jgi:hypothetical protein
MTRPGPAISKDVEWQAHLVPAIHQLGTREHNRERLEKLIQAHKNNLVQTLIEASDLNTIISALTDSIQSAGEDADTNRQKLDLKKTREKRFKLFTGAMALSHKVVKLEQLLRYDLLYPERKLLEPTLDSFGRDEEGQLVVGLNLRRLPPEYHPLFLSQESDQIAS